MGVHDFTVPPLQLLAARTLRHTIFPNRKHDSLFDKNSTTFASDLTHGATISPTKPSATQSRNR